MSVCQQIETHGEGLGIIFVSFSVSGVSTCGTGTGATVHLALAAAIPVCAQAFAAPNYYCLRSPKCLQINRTNSPPDVDFNLARPGLLTRFRKVLTSPFRSGLSYNTLHKQIFKWGPRRIPLQRSGSGE